MKRPVQHQNYYSCPHPSTTCMFTLVRLRPDSGHSTNNGSQPPNVTSALSARSRTANRCASMLSHFTLHLSLRYSCHQLKTISFGGHFQKRPSKHSIHQAPLHPPPPPSNDRARTQCQCFTYFIRDFSFPYTLLYIRNIFGSFTASRSASRSSQTCTQPTLPA